jgi:hypothetical protein
MTLGIAMRTPWGQARRYEKALPEGLGIAPGVALVSDSRFTTKGRRPNDGGAKMWFLTGGVVAIFSGRVEHAEAGLHRAKRVFKGAAPATVDQAGHLVKESLLAAASKGSRRRPDDCCSVILGVSALDGDAAIIRLDSGDDFAVQVGIDDEFIGQEDMADTVYLRLRKETKVAFADEPPSDDRLLMTSPGELALLLSAVVDDLVTSKANVTIGGQSQVAYVQQGQAFPVSAFRASAPEEGFEKRSASYDEVLTSNPERNKRRLSGVRKNRETGCREPLPKNRSE